MIFFPEPSTSAPTTQFCDACQVEVPTNRWKGHARTLIHREKCCVVQEEGIQLVKTSFRNRLATYRLEGTEDPTNVKRFLTHLQARVIRLVGKNVEKHMNLKIGMELFGRFLLQSNEEMEIKSFNSRFQMVSGDTDLEELFVQFRDILDKKASEFEEKESGVYIFYSKYLLFSFTGIPYQQCLILMLFSFCYRMGLAATPPLRLKY